MKKKSKANRKPRSLKLKSQGALVIIGGKEDKWGKRSILARIASELQDAKLVVSTLASEIPYEVWKEYEAVFKELGVKTVAHLPIEQPEEAREPALLKILDGAKGVFFSGGDQLRITTKIGGTPLLDRIFEIYRSGGIVAGTSAGAAAMGDNMLVGAVGVEPHKIGNWTMAPGLGLITDMIIDQHFAQRERISRLFGAVSLNPRVLGIGIDEDTAVVVQGDSFQVVGSHAVYVVDGSTVTHTNISAASTGRTMSMHDVTVHILCDGETFNMKNKRPSARS